MLTKEDEKYWRFFKDGKYYQIRAFKSNVTPQNKKIDLHGYTVNQAFSCFIDQIEWGYYSNIENIKFITGQGRNDYSINNEFLRWTEHPKIKNKIKRVAPDGPGAFIVTIKF